MLLQAVALFLLEASAGTSLLLVFFPHRVLGGGFFALHGLCATVFLGLAMAAGTSPSALGLALPALALLVAYTMLSRVGRQRAGLPWLAASSALQAVLLVRTFGALAPPIAPWMAGSGLLGALLFGSVLLTMNLGHWYLVSRTLPRTLLFGAAIVYTAAASARALYLAAAALFVPRAAGWEALTSLDRDLLFFLFRVTWGIAGPVALSYFVFQTAKMRSNQAATGLLYVALIFVLVGELLSAYLTALTRFPA
jgi:protein NrfD